MTTYTGTDANDTFSGSSGADTAQGQGGDDTLSGNNGNDILAGGAGADHLDGGAGSDALYSADISPVWNTPYYGNPYTVPVLDDGTDVDVLLGGSAYDVFYAGYGDSVDGQADGGGLLISFQGATEGVVAHFETLTQGGTLTIGGGTLQHIQSVLWVVGSEYGDDISVGWNSYGDSPLYGMGGDDHLSAGYYTGVLFGGDGNDIVDGRGSQYLQLVDGDNGNDTLYTDTNTFAEAYGGAGNDRIYSHGTTYGGAGNDTIILQDSYYTGNVYGDAGNDSITASSWGNYIVGGAGQDRLQGGDGADTLISGGFDFDTYEPLPDTGAEHDRLYGGASNDILYAGYGDDVDGGAGTDALYLSLLGANTGVSLDTRQLLYGGSVTLGGATITGIETLASLAGSNFADTLVVARNIAVHGNGGDDTLISAVNQISLFGDAGDDRLLGGAGTDTLDGGDGVDIASYANATAGVTVSLALAGAQNTGGAGTDTLVSIEGLEGSAFADSLTGNAGANVLDGGAGDDLLVGGLGDDQLDGGEGVDGVSYAAAAAAVMVDLSLGTATGGAGSDTLVAIENLVGTAFADILTGDGNANVLSGGSGDDRIEGGAGNDQLSGGNGIDTVSYAGATASVGVDLLAGTATGAAGTDQLSGFENVAGGAFNDGLTGDAGANRLDGAGGNDTLAGAAGDDVLVGGLGNDVLFGGAGLDTADYADALAGIRVSLALVAAQNTLGAGIDTLAAIENVLGSAFADALTGNQFANALTGGGGDDVLNGGLGNDALFGGDGIDTASYTDAAGAVHASLAIATAQSTGAAGSDTLIGIENLAGSAYDDHLTGNGGTNILTGNAGNDTLDGGAGDDNLVGGAGLDTASYAGAAMGVAVSLLITGAQDTHAAGLDTLSGIENLTGSAFGDVLTGNALANQILGGNGNDVIDGSNGNDTVDGGYGDDSLKGGFGDDVLTGGVGADTLVGGLGADTLTGGTQSDRFVYIALSDSTLATTDHITDFAKGDILDVSAIDANSMIAGNQAFVQAAAFTHTAGEFTLAYDAGTNMTTALFDTNGDAAADMAIHFTGDVTTLAGTWLL